MVIYTNSASNMILGETNRNANKLEKSLKKIASGMKINSAKDDSSGYSISEKMRVQVRSLNQDEMNAKNGRKLIAIAEGGIQDIINNLRYLKEKAINAANDTNTDEDRAIIQKEVNQRLEEIKDIAATTNYNGRLLLDGTWGSSGSDDDIGEEPTSIIDTISGTADYTITVDGVYEIDSGYQGTINVNSANVKLVSKTAGATLKSVFINCDSTNNDLWVEDLTIDNEKLNIDKNTICFSSATDKNRLHVIGSNKFTATDSDNKATVNIGGGLWIIGEGTGSSLDVSRYDTGYGRSAGGAAIGTDISKGGLNINAGDIKITGLDKLKVWAEYGAAIGTGWRSSYTNKVGNIYIDVNNLEATSMNGAGVGAGHSGTAGNVTIYANFVVENTYYGEAFVGYNGSTGTKMLNGTVYAGSEKKVTGTRVEPPEESGGADGEVIPLRIHTGTKASQNMAVIINSMDITSLKIADLEMTTRTKAENAISQVDKAIEYALNENTRMGAYQSKLEFTEANLVTAAENVTAAESVIRDADMAKEMTKYARRNVLMQAAQSMLAQSNQTPQQALSLLQEF